MSTDPTKPSARLAARGPEPPTLSAPECDPAPRWPWLSLLICLLVAAATCGAFWPTLNNNFINWDDPPNLIDNEYVQGLTVKNLKWMLTTFHFGHYQPLTWLSFAIDYHLWGGISARGIHLSSLVLHALNAVLFYFLALRLLRWCSRASGRHLNWGAGLAAALFALHPLRVESVAWATERRDLVSGLFFILALLAYLRHCSPGRRRQWFWLAAAVFLHACACLSKVMCVTLLAVIIVLDFYPLRRLGGPGRWWGAACTPVWLEKVPFLLVTLAASVIAPIAQGPAMLSLDYIGMDLRTAYTFLGLAFYFDKLLLPIKLIPIYEIRYQVSPLAWFFITGAVPVVAATVVLVAARRRFPAGLAVWLTYLAMLSPVTSLTQNGAQFAADRYTYVACLGLAVLVGGGLSGLLRTYRNRPAPITAITIIAIGLVGLLGRLTWRQTRLWHDSITLWSATLEVDPHSWVAHRNLADALMEEDQAERAALHYRRSLAVEQRNPSLHANASIAFARIGDLDQADYHAQQALEINPAGPNNLLNAAYVKRKMKQWGAAIEIYRRGAQWHADDVRFHAELGQALAHEGDHAAALESYRRALALAPDSVSLWIQAGASLLELGRFAEAEQMARRALEIKPGSQPAGKLRARIEARASLAAANQRVEVFRQALAASPDDPTARLSLADALAEARHWEEAAEQYSEVLFVQPSNIEVRTGLARALIASRQEAQAVRLLREGLDAGYKSTRLILLLARQLATSTDPEVRDGPEAVRLVEEFLQAPGQPSVQALGVLAAAYAEVGRFDDAVRTCQRAIETARQAGAEGMVQRQEERLELYRAGQPFRQPAPQSQPQQE